uniref:Protein kinase domain-containing protein n=1 Tax=Nelumbo nucifera TaxID=4432 RepID=A0A822ZHZ9_NELNU|nr:TPA_asm: hypothetical protein HUJ06_000886 [Nelumbo nucifera]
MGRLQHKNLVHMRGWCRKGNELMLVYDYMPNGSFSSWIFDKPNQLLGWEGWQRVLIRVAEGLNYLYHGWNQVVLHHDIKFSNILSSLEPPLFSGIAKDGTPLVLFSRTAATAEVDAPLVLFFGIAANAEVDTLNVPLITIIKRLGSFDFAFGLRSTGYNS